MRTRLAGLVVLTLAAAACTDSAGYSVRTDPTVPRDVAPVTTATTTTTEATSSTEPAATAPPIAAPAGDPIVDGVANSLIVVHDQDGGPDALASYRTDGTRAATYSADDDAIIWQPIWSPDGRRLAWTHSVDAGRSWELATAAVDGGDRTAHALPGRPDYITYDPTGARVLALTPSPEGFGLVIIEVAEPDQPFTVVDLGRPYFSDFSPGGERLIAHVAADLRVVGVGGEQQPLDLVSVTHQTPAWHPSEDKLFFTTDLGAGARIVSYDLGSGETTDLAGAADFVFFDLDPTGRRLAVSAFGAPTGTTALRGSAGDDLTTGLWVVDVAGGTTTLLSAEPASSPMWDPTGTKVLVRDGLAGPGTWKVFGIDGRTGATDAIDVDTSLLPAYLPFWDQYERSQTVWSPDGGHFVHAGVAADGRAGVWIHDASTTGPSTFLVEGDLAFWSPT